MLILLHNIGCNNPTKNKVLATERIIKNAHKRNVAVMYWTINGQDEMRQLIELDADGIMTDYPSRLRDVLEENRLRST